MSTIILSSARRSLALPAFALALSLAGCGSDAGSDGAKPKMKPVMPAENRPVTAPPVDLDGVWQAQGDGNLTLAEKPQFTDVGAKAFAANKSAMDPAARCLPPGVPRLMVTPQPFSITWNQDLILMHFQLQRLDRFVALTDRFATNGDASFLGQARAHWDKQTLVIETTNQKAGGWLDGSGLPHGTKVQVSERISLEGKDQMVDHVTITDPEMYRKPVTADIKFSRRKEIDVAEDVCVERQGIHP